MEAAAAKLMDFSQPMDVTLLDQVVTTAFDASHPQVYIHTCIHAYIYSQTPPVRVGGGGREVACCADSQQTEGHHDP